MVDDDKLSKVIDDLERTVTGKEDESVTRERLQMIGLTEHETQSWLAQEPSYDKNILKPSDDFIHRRRSDEDYTEPPDERF